MAAKVLASREQILNVDDVVTRDLEVPEWGGLVVRLRSLDALTGMRLAREMSESDDDVRVRIVLASCVDDSGAPLFLADDLEKLAKKNFEAIRRVSDAAMELFRQGADVERARENF